ncbi:MAG: methionine aminotransferase [Bacteroidota bacterium]
MNLSSRLPDIGTSIFTVMSKMAAEHGAINLSQGFPDFPVSAELVDLIYKNLKAGHNQYAPMPGVPVLRQQIADVVRTTYQRVTDPDTEITITAGGTEALFSALAALVHPGDEVIVFDPAFDSYNPAIRLNGGVPIHIALNPTDFSVDWAEVKRKITPRTKVILINTPHNPSGAVLAASDLLELQNIAVSNGLFVISDEVYERLIFENKSHESVLKYPALMERSVAVFSFGKTFHATGWKIGYTIAPANITTEIRRTHQFITFAVNTPIQYALAEYLSKPEHYDQLGQFYQRKRDFFLNQIKGSSFEPKPCYGSYFQLVSYKNISQKSDTEMAEWLTKTHKVASIPVSVFYNNRTDHHLLRFCFAKTEETLEKAGSILRQF